MKARKGVSDRALRIEILRARAALERQGLRQSLLDLGEDLSPGALASSILPEFNSRTVASGLGRLFALSRRYPLILSTASTLLSGLGRKGRWWRLAAGAALSWYVGTKVGGRR